MFFYSEGFLNLLYAINCPNNIKNSWLRGSLFLPKDFVKFVELLHVKPYHNSILKKDHKNNYKSLGNPEESPCIVTQIRHFDSFNNILTIS